MSSTISTYSIKCSVNTDLNQANPMLKQQPATKQLTTNIGSYKKLIKREETEHSTHDTRTNSSLSSQLIRPFSESRRLYISTHIVL